MDYLLAGTDIRLTYLQDQRALARIDWTAVVDDLTEGGVPLARLPWCNRSALTHVVLATDRGNGRIAGIVGLIERTTALEPYLLVDAISVRPEDSARLPLSMLAHILTRLVCLDGKPPALAARGGDRQIEPVLRQLGDAVTGADVHPPLAPGNVIALRPASLARRVGAGYTVLDMRSVMEAAMLRELRRLHRARLERAKTKAGARGATSKAARTAGAMRRPRTATHTDKTA